MRLQHFDAWCLVVASSLSSLCSLLKKVITGLRPGVRFRRLLARSPMPRYLSQKETVSQVFPRPLNDNATKHVDAWCEQGVHMEWPEDVPKRAVMVRDQAKLPPGTSSFLKKATLTKNPVERSMFHDL